MTEAESKLLADIAAREAQLVAQTRELVSIPTVNPYSGDSSAGIEAAGQDWVADRLETLGARVRRVPVPADVYARGGMIGPPGRSWHGRENVVAEWTLGDGAGPCILLNDHIDTVGTDGMEFDPFDPVVKDGKVYGRGTSDTKGNMVMGMTAVAALLEHADGLNGRVVFESVVDEECNGGGAGTLACCLAGVTADFALVLDGSMGAIINGCNGVATARVRVFGRAGHSAYGLALSAIDKGIVVKQAIDVFAAEHRRAFPDCHINLGIFRSGTLPAIVPGEAELQLNLSYDVADARRAEAEQGAWDGRCFRGRFEQALRDLGETDPWFKERPVVVEWIKDLYPFVCDADEPRIALALRAAREVEGPERTVAPMTAWFDAAHLNRQLGIPVIGVGHGAPGTAHSAAEFAVVDQLVAGAKTVGLVLHRLLSR